MPLGGCGRDSLQQQTTDTTTLPFVAHGNGQLSNSRIVIAHDKAHHTNASRLAAASIITGRNDRVMGLPVALGQEAQLAIA